MQALGVAGDRGGEQALLDLYPKADTPALRDAVLQGLLIAGDSDAVVALYRKAQDDGGEEGAAARADDDGRGRAPST